jgi:hypothetical protein
MHSLSEPWVLARGVSRPRRLVREAHDHHGHQTWERDISSWRLGPLQVILERLAILGSRRGRDDHLLHFVGTLFAAHRLFVGVFDHDESVEVVGIDAQLEGTVR